MSRFIVLLTSLFSVLAFLAVWHAAVTPLSHQACRMSWMSPSYILQANFDKKWSQLAGRYSLWLYREVGWEEKLHGQPVLFIPGNAGSSRQVRSIASSSTRQYFSQPYTPALSAPLRPIDYFSVDFNEDFSALHGPTLDAQRQYCAAAVSYILSLYESGTKIILMGHSMGGIVATALLPNPNVSAVITMSSPHALPPARFDRRIPDIYARTQKVLAHDPTPVLSLCGGATDGMIPSEYCILPVPETNEGEMVPYRRTVFTSALEGAWTGVSHQVIVWCHQVRWRVARAAIELSGVSTLKDQEERLDRWLSDGLRLPARESRSTLPSETIQGAHMVDSISLHNPTESKAYILRVPDHGSRFVLWVDKGSISPLSLAHPSPLSVGAVYCDGKAGPCQTLRPNEYRILPHPFPSPNAEGIDESEGIIVLEANVNSGHFIVVNIEYADGHGSITAGFTPPEPIVVHDGAFRAIWSKIPIPLNPNSLSAVVHLPNLRSHSFLVYRVVPVFDITYTCSSSPLLPPMLTHTSPSEAHHHSLHPDSAVYLHAHTDAPYLPHNPGAQGVAFTIRASYGCAPAALHLTIDWWRTLGRLGPRLWPAVAAWSVGLASLMLMRALPARISSPPTRLTVGESLSTWIRQDLWAYGIPSVLVFGVVPLSPAFGLGTQGELLFTPLYAVILVLSSGTLCALWVVLQLLLSVMAVGSSIFTRALKRGRAPSPNNPTPRNGVTAFFSLSLVFALVALLVPWQVAFLGC